MKTYCNPIKKQGDFADPFVMRYNGTYYLYATNPDIRCWSSVDLLEWKEEGAAISTDEFPELVPFAPEVVYHNGAFYMYTSPSGTGHYVLKSELPTGPFRKITSNIGHSIDGSVYIDDDGQWYFYWADDSGILCCKMSAPDVLEEEAVNTGAFLHGWTEGPMVVKEEGLYYMTYTGNHYLSPGYRIHAAVSKDPLGPYQDVANNPILVHTTGKNIGLGHSSTIQGPDLATKYIIYHNMNPDLTRDLNIDVILLEDGRVQVAGPSRTPQSAPAMPLYRFSPEQDDFGEMWTVCEGSPDADEAFRCEMKQPLPEQGAIECNLISNAMQYGVTIGTYMLRFDKDANTVSFCCLHLDAPLRVMLDTDYKHDVLHCILLRYHAGIIDVYLDARQIFSEVYSDGMNTFGLFAANGRIRIGCVTISDAVKSEGPCYPIPCQIRAEKTVCVNVPEDGRYTLTIMADEIGDADNSIMIDEITCLPYEKTADCAVYLLDLQQGQCSLNLQFGAGILNPRTCFFHQEATGEQLLSIPAVLAPVGKSTISMDDVMDYKAILSFEGEKPSVKAGILFRASELALGGEGDDELLGINFFIGYCAAIDDGWLVLSKHRYDCVGLARVPVLNCGSITVKTHLNDIQIFCNDANIPAIQFHDNDPILYGRVGVRTIGCTLQNATITIEYDNISKFGGTL